MPIAHQVGFEPLSVEQSWGLPVARRRRSAASTQTVASGAKMLMFPQTSSSSSCAISESPSSRSRLDSSAGISSAAASRPLDCRSELASAVPP